MHPETVEHFLAVEDGQPSLAASRFAIIPVPYERTVSYGGGTEKGPQAILDASPQIELWDEETKTETWEQGIHTLPAINCKGSEKAVFDRIEKYATNFLEKNKALPFYLGGEHSISQALINPYIKKHGKKLSVLHFDAHADLRKEYFGDSRSHACALYPASRQVKVVQVGIRSVGSDEKQNINSGNVKTFLMHEHLDIKKLIPAVLKELTETVYLTIDVDGFDPAVVPGTGTPQPGGFSWYEGLELFKAIIAKKKIVAVDVVETAPIKGSHISEFNVAKFIYRLMGYLAIKKK
ncbi:MAG: agmatinase [Elusimicrobiota bacterium]|jgi:agmatinase|nr:agmatinase [Elusimicrobiota bacterium]